MDRTDAPDDDLSPLEQRRARLRAFSDEVMEAIRALPMPQSYLEGERAMRCIVSSDRAVVQLFSKVNGPKRAQAKPAVSRPAAPQSAAQPLPVSEPAFVYDYDDEDDDTETGDTETGEGARALDAVLDALENPGHPAPLRSVTAAHAAVRTAQNPVPDRAAKLDQTYGELADKLIEGQALLRQLSP